MPPCFSSWGAKPPRSLEAVTARAYYPLLPLPRPLPISPLSFRMGGAAAMFTNKPSLRGLILILPPSPGPGLQVVTARPSPPNPACPLSYPSGWVVRPPCSPTSRQCAALPSTSCSTV